MIHQLPGGKGWTQNLLISTVISPPCRQFPLLCFQQLHLPWVPLSSLPWPSRPSSPKKQSFPQAPLQLSPPLHFFHRRSSLKDLQSWNYLPHHLPRALHQEHFPEHQIRAWRAQEEPCRSKSKTRHIPSLF